MILYCETILHLNIEVNDSKLASMGKVSPSTRLLYLILHGYKVMGRVDVHYDELMMYSNLTGRTITKSIKELIDKEYIESTAKGRYIIL